MSSCLFLLFVAFACTGQTPPPLQQVVVPEHTSFVATLKHTLNVAKVKVGDDVELNTEQAMLISNGRVVHAGARLLGKVVEASPITKENKQARLSVLIDRFQWNGGSVPLHAFITGFLSRVISTDNALMRSGRSWSDEVLASREPADDRDSRFAEGRGSVQATPSTSSFRSMAEISEAARLYNRSDATVVIRPGQFLRGVKIVRIREPSPGSLLVRDGKNFSIPGGMLVTLEQSEQP